MTDALDDILARHRGGEAVECEGVAAERGRGAPGHFVLPASRPLTM